MRALIRILFLTILATVIFSACGKKSDNGYYPNMPGYPGYPPGQPWNPHAYSYKFVGVSTITDAKAFDDYLRSDFCIRTIIFKTCDAVRLVNNPPIIEFVTSVTEINPHTTNPATVKIKLITDYGVYINGTNTPTDLLTVNLRPINNNSGFEGAYIRRGNNGLGATLTIRGIGKPTEDPIYVEILFNQRPMLHATLTRSPY